MFSRLAGALYKLILLWKIAGVIIMLVFCDVPMRPLNLSLTQKQIFLLETAVLLISNKAEFQLVRSSAIS